MSFLGWMALVGVVLLLIALSSAYLKHVPVTTSALYLALGVTLSSVGFALIQVDFVEQAVLFEHLTEIAVIISLFVGGLKLRMPFRDAVWSAAYRLTGPVMIATICGIAVFSHFVFGLGWPVSFLLGAVLAPTDPVLASTVSVNNAADRDRMRYGLSGEAGFNDGAAFPFVILALMWMQQGELGQWLGGWALHRIIWAVPAGLIFGYFLGSIVGRLSIWLRSRHRDTDAPNDLLAMALIAIAYVGAEWIWAWGFLSVFAAGLGFRRAEIKVTEENPITDSDLKSPRQPKPEANDPLTHPPAEEMVGLNKSEEELEHPAMAGGVVISEIISFGDTAERLLEVMMVALVGVCLATYWDWRAVPLAAFLFLILRPASVAVFLVGTPTYRYQRLMMAWFGIRGIGSLYYLSYSLNHGLTENISEVVGITLSMVAMSILLHGITSQPALSAYERYISKKPG